MGASLDFCIEKNIQNGLDQSDNNCIYNMDIG
jgi:hypothetical protein